ncbi:TPA: ribosomal-protein-alanine N-acetyltransferase [bacterium]|nr:MAG: ribosomal-protein-alanine N-acetyltransferase [Candidatus Hydrogenedentes bacterium CG1_02_42_14]PIU48007.1 MAG: ribosomal-protein-alanine N-acetyltransferase [Candidatus Hydrogenedentes bacterium CG07_land_8_20_14_0_80_42_17]HBW46953.1 ribosomal-protein-alanine N-acetyltransferase [bacterium]
MIVPISKEKISEILEIEHESYSLPWSERMFLAEFENELGISFGYEVNGKLVGFIFAWMIFEDIHINNIAVAQAERRKGIGRKLLEHTFNEVRKKGVTKAMLEVRPSNKAALELYSQYGFKLMSVRKKYYTDTNEDALILIAELNR